VPWRASTGSRVCSRCLPALVWPVAAGLFGFGWLELVQPNRTTLPVLRLWALAWLVILIVGAIVFGQRWIGAADPFKVYASTLAPDVDLAARR
jgi:hypothetical protein